MPRRNYANIQWTITDVMENCEQFGIEITRREARKVLAAEERYIEDTMVEAGWRVIEDALRRGLGDK